VLKSKLFKTAAVGASTLGIMGVGAGSALAQDTIKQSQDNDQHSKAKTDQSYSPTSNNVGNDRVAVPDGTAAPVLVRRRPTGTHINQSGNHANTKSGNWNEQSQKAKQSGDPSIDQSQKNDQDSKAKTDQSHSPTSNNVGSSPVVSPRLAARDGSGGNQNKINQSGNHANTSSSNSNEQEQGASQGN
jgi:hypothetical protein